MAPAEPGRETAAPLAALAAFAAGAVLLGLPALLLPGPLGLLATLPGLLLQLVGAAFALRHRPAGGLLSTLQHRGAVALPLLIAAMLPMAALLAWPALQLLRAPTLGAALAASLAAAVGGLLLARVWPAPVLPLTEPERSGRGGPRPLECLREARRLVLADPSGGRALFASAVLTVLLIATLGLGVGAEQIAERMRWLLYPAWALLLGPFLSFVLIALVEPARLASAQTPVGRIPRVQPAATPEPVAVRDPTAQLYAFARAGRVESALAALDEGADPHALPEPAERDQRTLAMLAAVLPDLRLLRALIGRGVDLNRRHAGLTALLAATRDSLQGRPEAVTTLLANGADPRVADAEGRTALHFAALLGEPDVAALLLDAGALIDACNRDGYSPLGVACAAGNWRMARFLLEHRARPEPPFGQPALLAAAAAVDDDPAGITLLLRHRARVDARGRLGRSALMNACLAGHAEVAAALLAAGADIDAADEHGVTPLLEAARAGADAVIARLAPAAPSTDAVDASGRNALALACQSSKATPATIDALLALGVDSRHPAGDGRRPLDVAIGAGRWALVARLDPDYPLPASLETEPAPTEAAREAAQAAQAALPWGERLRHALLDARSDVVAALLHAPEADPANCAEMFDDLAEVVAPPLRQRLAAALDPVDEPGGRRVRGLLERADGVGIDCLLERGASVAGAGGLAAYLQGCLNRERVGADAETRALRLLDAGADPFASALGEAALPLAVRLDWPRLVEALLARGVDPEQRGRGGASALLLACSLRRDTLLPRLLAYGAQPERPAPDGRTARGLALAQSDRESIRWLDWRGWRPPRRPLRDDDLVAAAALGDREAVARLLDLGLPLAARDAQGANPLLRACGGGHLALVEDLLARGADPSLPAASGATCLSAAVSRRQLPVVRALLARGASIDQRLPGGVTALMVAAALGHADVVAALLAAGADPNACDELGNGAAHALAQFGFGARDAGRVRAAWSALLDAGAAIDTANGAGQTPLLLLLGCKVEPGASADEDTLGVQLELLLARGVDLDARDGRGFAPLHLAALHGQMKAVRRLLAAGADRTARDNLNRSPQDIALMRGFVDIARELAPLVAAPPPSMARLLREPPRG